MITSMRLSSLFNVVVFVAITLLLTTRTTNSNKNGSGNFINVVHAAAPPTTKATARLIKVLNESGSRVEIYWIHPQTRATTLLTTPNIMNGATFPLNSYVGHEFEGMPEY
jgi:hypothetical protein